MNVPVRGFLVAVLAILLMASAAWAGPYTGLVAFGDSLSDAGNAGPGWNGRASNGPVWAEYLASSLGIAPFTRSLSGGTDYAYYGSTTVGTQPNLGWQVSSYLGPTGVNNVADPHALYSVWSGPNDFFVAAIMYSGGNTTAFDAASTWANNVTNAVDQLRAAGATNFVVPNLAALVCTPMGNGMLPEGRAIIESASLVFNNQLAANLQAIKNLHPELKIATPDIYNLLKDAVVHPGNYGFTNVTDQAYNAPSGTDVSGYMFWDIVHPTTGGHAMLANFIGASLVPEPGTFVLLAIGAAMCLAATVRRRLSFKSPQ